MPISCIIGNTLVVAAVLSNKSLQTPTNYLLVSLACADLMVGTLVAPFHIYMTVRPNVSGSGKGSDPSVAQINSLHWHLPALTCYIYCVLDVIASTSSIIHLLLISMDRFSAHSAVIFPPFPHTSCTILSDWLRRPSQPSTKPTNTSEGGCVPSPAHSIQLPFCPFRRVYLAIVLCWLFSILLSLPLVFGTNEDTERYLLEDHHCGIYNPTYMFSSSIFAFFLPLFLMSLIYG